MKKIGEKEAKAKDLSLPVSFKQCVELCRTVRGKPVSKAIVLLEKTAAMKASVEFKRFNRGGLGHRAGKGPSRYPVNASKAVIKLLKSAQANAEQKGLNREGLVIESILAQKASNSYHYGRQRRRRMKRTHLEVLVKETVPAEKKPKQRKAAPAKAAAQPKDQAKPKAPEKKPAEAKASAAEKQVEKK
ncbi:50S ribosomal protein L22 [Candidatus Woesearchaeota archaeon]|nr:50S ribosomal protein L22 [Candidatus Woesearchaeota archaeon]